MRNILTRAGFTALLAAALLGGCSMDAATSSGAANPNGADAGSVQKVQVPGTTTESKTDTSVPQSPLDGTQQIIRSATMTVVIDDPAAAATRLRAIASSHGGVVTTENVVSGDQARYTQSLVVLSVPADQLDGALSDIANIGEVRLRTIQSSDVTAKVADVDARIKTMRDSIARMQELLKRAGSVAEISQVEKELTQRQSDLESLLAQQKALAQRVAQSPITVTLTKETAVVTTPKPEIGFLAGLRNGWSALKETTVVVLMLLGTLLPFLVAMAVVITPIVWLVRRRRRRAVTVPAPTTPRDESRPSAPES